jgi:hypothetical protein
MMSCHSGKFSPAPPPKKMCPYAYAVVYLLCLTPDNFTRQVESAATQWVNQLKKLPMHPLNPLSGNAP